MRSQARFNRVPKRFRRRFWEALVHSQVRFNRAKVPEKVPEKSQRRYRRRSIGSFGFWCSQVRFNRVPDKVPALGFAARFR